jgi:hemolysin activation/secretion protein
MECQFISTIAAAVKFAGRSRLCALPGAAIVSLLGLAGGSAGLAQTAAISPEALPVPSEAAQPMVTSFRVQRYAITGSSAVSQETIDRVMGDAVGDAVKITQIRRALLRLQQAFRDRGYAKVSVTLPQQPLTNGVVCVRVAAGPASSAPETQPAELPQWSLPAYDVRHFEVYGNTLLTPEEIDRILSPAAGPAASLDELHKALARLQFAYRERGLVQASVTLPQQLLTDGTVIIQIAEGPAPGTEAVARTQPTITPEPKPLAASTAGRTFEVRHYEVIGNTLLRPETITPIFHQATGTNVTFAQIQKALGELQFAYRERGFASASVFLPQQQLTNATVKVQVTEGRLVDVRVTGNHYFSSNNVMRALPSVREALIWNDEVVNSRVLQREVDLANQNRDRQIYPVINPGPEPGSSALDLRIQDRLPFHGRLEVNNQSTPGTPEWRINANANYNNLWQLEHAIGVFYGFTPEAFKSGGLVDDYVLNRPLIANYGGYYRMPFGAAESINDTINNSPVKFGYDEATHQFRLPPAGARPDLTVYASGASSDTGVKFGPRSRVGTNENPLLTIYSQDSGQDITINESGGGRLNLPVILSDTKRLSFAGGVDWKRYFLTSYNTNNFTTLTTTTNAQGSLTVANEFPSSQPVRRTESIYLPLSLGADYLQTDKHGTFSASVALSYNFIGDSRTHFTSPDWNATNPMPTSYSPTKSDLTYGKANLSLARDQKIFKDWSLYLRASGQAATKPLINNEQFALGGLSTVRGYAEGDEYGDDGWSGGVELRTPFIATHVPAASAFVPAWLRGTVFMDGGQCILLDGIAGLERSRFLWGVGFGLSANFNNHLDMNITLGWPLLNSADTRAGGPRACFSFGGQF